MKKITLALILMLIGLEGSAVVRIWVGTTNSLALASNWSPAGFPIFSDDVVFNNNKNCRFNRNLNVYSITIASTYSGTIDRTSGSITTNTFICNNNFDISDASGTITVNSGASIVAGYVNFGTSPVTVNNLTVSGGTLELGGSNNILTGDVIVSGGTLLLSSASGNVIFEGSLIRSAGGIVNGTATGAEFNTDNSTISGGFNFRNVRFNSPQSLDIDFYINGLLATNSLEFSPTDATITVNKDPIYISSDFNIGSPNFNDGTVISNNSFIFNGSVLQNLNLQNSASRTFKVGNLIFVNTGLGVSLSAPINGGNLTGGVTVASGTFSDNGNAIALAANQNFSLGANTTYNCNNSTLPIVSGSGIVSISGTSTLNLLSNADQTLTGNHSYGNLNLRKIGGGVYIAGTQSVNNFLTISLTGANKLNTGGTLTLNSTASLTASLIDYNNSASSVNGNITVQRFFVGGGRAKSFGAPIISANVTTIGEGAPGQGTWKALLYTETGQEAGIPRLAPSFLGSFRNASLVNSGALTVGRGYSLRKDINGTLNYTGVVNNGTITIPITNTPTGTFAITPSGFNLMSNPYPSAIDWSKVNKGGTGVNNLAVQIFNGSGYTASVNIGSSQGFFVRATTSGDITFDNTCRISSGIANNTFLRKEQESKLFYLYAKSISGGFNDALAFSYNDYATLGFEPSYDLQKIFVAAAPSSPVLYSNIGTIKTSLDVQPYPTADVTIPIAMFINAAGDYTFTSSSINNWYSDYSVFLRDSTANGILVTNLKNIGQYNFNIDQTNIFVDKRFSLIFKYTPGANNGGTIAVINQPGGNNDGNGGFTSTGAGIDFPLSFLPGMPDSELRVSIVDSTKEVMNFEKSISDGTIIYVVENKLYVDFKETENSNSDIVIVDMLGRLIYSKSNIISKGNITIPLSGIDNSVYVVRLLNNKENITKKFLLKN